MLPSIESGLREFLHRRPVIGLPLPVAVDMAVIHLGGDALLVGPTFFLRSPADFISEAPHGRSFILGDIVPLPGFEKRLIMQARAAAYNNESGNPFGINGRVALSKKAAVRMSQDDPSSDAELLSELIQIRGSLCNRITRFRLVIRRATAALVITDGSSKMRGPVEDGMKFVMCGSRPP
jgi:hypothetical protein